MQASAPIEQIEKPPVRRKSRRLLLVPVLVACAFGLQLFHVWSNDALISAITDGDESRVHWLLTLRADPNWRFSSISESSQSAGFFGKLFSFMGIRHRSATENCRTALMLAAAAGRVEMVRDLLDHGADPNITLRIGVTAISACGVHCPKEILESLLSHGASVAGNPGSIAPILLAAQGGKIDNIRLLLDHGANIHEIGNSKQTPLLLAAFSGNDRAVEYLISRGAGVQDLKLPVNVLVMSPRGKGGLVTRYVDLLTESGSLAMIPVVWNQIPDSEIKGVLGLSCLTIAIERDHPAMAAELIRRGVRVKTLDSQVSIYPANSAIDRVDLESLRLLLARGATIPGLPRYDSPFVRAVKSCLASQKGSSGPAVRELLTLLVKNGADVNGKDRAGKTALFYTLASPDLTRIVLDLGAQVNARDKSGATPLFGGEYYKSSPALESMELLIKHGADVNARDNNGNTPLMMTPWQRRESVKLLLDHGADPNATNRTGGTPLAAAYANWGDKNVIKLLHDAGANENMVSRQAALNAQRIRNTPPPPMSGAMMKSGSVANYGARPVAPLPR